MFPFNFSSPADCNKLYNYINKKAFRIGRYTLSTAPNNIPRQRVCMRNGFGTTKPRMLTEGQRLLFISRSTFALQQIFFLFCSHSLFAHSVYILGAGQAKLNHFENIHLHKVLISNT